MRMPIQRVASQAKYDLAVVGHIVFDYITRGKTTYPPQLGSPCVYASLGARALRASVTVASTVGREFGEEKLNWIRDHGINIDYVRRTDSSTTSFKIKYENGKRSMQVASKCDRLTPLDIFHLPSSSAIHIGPILNEVSQSLALSLTQRNAVISLDPQGYLRRMLHDGRIVRTKWRNRKLLARLDVLKVSEDEASKAIGRISFRRSHSAVPGIILLTKGRLGTILSSKDHGAFAIPAYKTRVRDPTGAGDALIGAFLTTLVRTGDITWSAAVGSAVASFVVEKVGPSNFGTKKQVEMRARRIHDGIVRLRS